MPDTLLTIGMFLTLLFFALSLTFTTIIFLIFHKTHSRLSAPKKLPGRSLKYGFFMGLVVAGTLGFKAFDLINPLNYGLFLVFCILIYFQLRSPKI
ncbi:hypothetical protein C4561_04045 [candidate division WWE3 bacterium]|jgi:hypothetical protein|uniref:Uncharacterized protein n=1 Tax=candidate division WWE3 bacterium TaxID=2053526 RepID=A0A3A4ZCH2_UNCKA|nr:MAG: hypothetical protein C4561_04045 [candidate division WWE3 bacterium]